MSVTKSTMTDSDGNFSITDLPNGTYNVTMSKEGYYFAGKTITINNGDITGDSVIITPTTTGHKVTISVKENNIGISGVSVTMGDRTKTTDTDGKCTFTDVVDGTYTATANKTGYQEGQETVVVSGADVDKTINITKIFTVSGVVKHGSSGALLEGATVKLGTEETTTNSDGVYTFSNVLEGSYEFSVLKDYYESYTEASLSVHADVTKDVTLTDNYAVVGVVKYGDVLTDGVTVTVKQGSTVIGSDTTDTGGSYSIPGCTTGDYTVSIHKTGFEDQSQDITITGESTTCNFGITKPSLSLTVKDTNGSPVEGAAVSFDTYSGITNSAGLCFIDDIEPNTYEVSVSCSHYTGNTKEITIESVDVTDEIIVTPDFRVNGYVRYNSVGVENASVSVDGGTAVLTDADGIYTVTGLDKGSHTITVSKDGYKTVSDSFTITTDNVNKNIDLTRFNVKFSIVDENSSALQGASVLLDGVTKTTDSSGECTFSDMSNGSYSASISKEHYTSKNVDVIVSNSDVEISNSIKLIFIITGTVKDADGNVMSGATVSVSSPALSATSGSDGAYSINSSEITLGSELSMSCSKSGYATSSGTLSVSASDLTKDFTLSGFNVNVTVKDSVSSTGVEGATVTLE